MTWRTLILAVAALPLAGCSLMLPAESTGRVEADAPLLGDVSAEVAPLDREPTIEAAERRLKVRRVDRRDWKDQAAEFRDCVQQQQFIGAKPCPCFFINSFAANARQSSNDYRDAGCVDAPTAAPGDPVQTFAPPTPEQPDAEPLVERVATAEGRPGAPYRDRTGAIHDGYGDRADGGDWDRLQANLRLAREDARAVFGAGFDDGSAARQDALTELAFIVGRTELANFVRLKAAVLGGDWRQAAAETLDSAWARSDPHRARDIANRLMEATQ